MSPEKTPQRLPSWADQLDDEAFSWERAVGGWRGVAESILPGLVFVVVYVLTRDLLWACAASGAIALVAVLARLVQRQQLTQALSGVFGVVIGIVWAMASGRGENYFTWGLIAATGFLALTVGSLLVRRSIVSLAAAALWQLPAGWREDPENGALLARCRALTWVWAGLFAIRLGVQYPLWQAGMVAELGIAKLVLGLPLFALACWLTWAGLRPFAAVRAAAEPHD